MSVFFLRRFWKILACKGVNADMLRSEASVVSQNWAVPGNTNETQRNQSEYVQNNLAVISKRQLSANGN
jgi:hypothetical protein